MRAKKEWNTKATKREAKKEDHGIIDVLKITDHFFPELSDKINQMNDPRSEPYCTYTQADYIFLGILKNICGQKTMTGMDEMFNEEACIEILGMMSGHSKLEEMPHKDSLNYYLEKQSPDELSDVRTYMIRKLIRSKNFNGARLLGKYWRIILDGTGLHYYEEKPDGHCLVTKIKDADGKEKKLYYRKVLEAKIVLGEKLILSLDTEFIENESEDVPKQDCELNAAKRILERINKNYPRLRICIQGDGLYATKSMMAICDGNKWKYIFTQKEGRQRALAEAFEYIKGVDGAKEEDHICAEDGKAVYENDVDEVAGKTSKMNVFEYAYEDADGEKKRFQWVTNIRLTEYNIEEMVLSGRGRWKIENKGFNEQKNGIYDIEHLNSKNYNAIKNHYLITQIADIIMRLYLSWSPVLKKIGESIKNTSSRLLESFRRHTVTDEDVSYIKRRTSVYLE